MRPLTAALVVCTLAVAAQPARAGECVFEGTFVGVAAAGEIDGLPFAHPVFESAVAVDCPELAAVVPILPDPSGRRWVAGTPQLERGRRYRAHLAPATALGTHALVRAEPVDARASEPAPPALDRIPAGEYALDKSGNGQPPCSRLAWRPEAMPIEIEIHQAVTDDVGDGSDLAAIETAIDLWGTAPCSAARLRLAATYDRSTPLVPDGVNSIEWIEEPAEVFDNLGPENLGFTCYVCDEEGYFVEADVRFDGARHTWSTDCDGEAFDVLGAVLHELGHVLGAQHVDQPEAVMFPVTSPRRLLATRVLSRDDMLDVCERYPCPTGDCSRPVQDPGACTVGAGMCAPCSADGECGASPDVCATSSETGRSICARACSPSFPCPAGFDCVAVGAASKQCVPVGESCPDHARLGCACELDDDCAGAADRCVDGRCATPCDGGVACPEAAACTLLYDDLGLPTSRFCLADEGHEPRCAPRRRTGCDCASPNAPAPALPLVVLALTCLVVRGRAAR